MVVKLNENTKQPPALGFGTRAPRFNKENKRPRLDPSGMYAGKDVGCDSSLYQPIRMNKVNKNTVKLDPWRRKAEVKEWTKQLGYRNEAIVQEREWRAAFGGPASHNVKEIRTDFSKCKNTGFGTAIRFKPVKFCTPPPGTYFKRTPSKPPHGPHSNVQTFDYSEPCRFKEPPLSQAPNRYKIVDKESIEMKPKKLVSRRGPYDLFTGPRDDTNIKNHFGVAKCYSTTWPLSLPRWLDGCSKSHLGKMNKSGRDARYGGRNALTHPGSANRSPNEPGPAVVNLNPPTVYKQNKAPFLSWYDGLRGPPLGVSCPGVGRYDIEPLKRHVPGNGHKHVFLSKVPRTSGYYVQPPMNSF